MTGRLFSLAFCVLALCGSASVQAQYPGHAANGPVMYHGGLYQPTVMQPLTQYYEPGYWHNQRYEQLSGDRGWDYENTPVDEFFKDLVQDSYFRVEYLNWSIKDPGENALGSAVQGIVEARRPFPVTVAGMQVGEARVATLDRMTLDHRDGIRGTLGVPLRVGTLEGSVFFLNNNDERNEEPGLGAPPIGSMDQPQFIATSTLFNNQLSNNLFLYDSTFVTEFSSKLWGAQINYVMDQYDPASSFHVRPLFGFRYVDVSERLVQTGSFDQQGALLTPLVSVITTNSNNHVYVGQAGLRMELVKPRFAIGLEPKLGVGANVLSNGVVVERLRSFGDPTITTRIDTSRISVVGDLNIYARINLGENFSVMAGYNVIFIDNVARPHHSIHYNDNGPNADADVRARESFELMYYQGVTVSGELRF